MVVRAEEEVAVAAEAAVEIAMMAREAIDVRTVKLPPDRGQIEN
jgi:hypothetical protein